MIILFALGILFYFALSVGSKVFFLKKSRSIQDTLSMCVVFPSAIYFGYPIAQALFPGLGSPARTELDQAQNMFNIGYWIFMCAYALYIIRRKVDGIGLDGKNLKTPTEQKTTTSTNKFSRQDFKHLILSPIIMALIVGFVLWVMQLIPGIKVIHTTANAGDGWNTIPEGNYSITRIDALIPGANQILTVLAALPTPLAWLAVGAVVAKGSVKEALKNKLAWYGVALKNGLMPLLTLGLVVVFAAIGHAANDAFTISAPALVVIVLMAASPTATTVVSYAIVYDKEPRAASEVCTLTTLMAVITLPIWTIVTAIIGTTEIFTQF
jgi:malate permease and related proteins